MQKQAGVYKRVQQLLAVAALALLAACGGGGGGGGLPASNVAPVANAGLPQNITTGAVVTLDASKSTDGNADPLTYKWSLTSKPASSTAVLSSTAAVKPTFTADLSGAYVFSLIVNDGKVDSPAASVTVNASVTNVAPVANAGTAQSVIAGTLVTLDGSTSSDSNGDTLTYAWTISSKPLLSSASLSGADTAKPTFTADNSGSYVISLIVSDGRLSSTAATVTVTAAAANVTPVANAGVAQNISTGAVVTLDGSGSTDANGDSLVYTWSITSKPTGSTAALSDVAAIKPTFTADKAGTYIAQLIVYDGKATSAAATVTITVTPATTNAAPIANAGVAQNVTTGTLVTLNGSGSTDANGDTLTYSWSLTSKPGSSSAVLSSTTAVSPTFTADQAGTYVATLVVNDGKVNSAAATVAVTAAVANVAPVANAGTAQTVNTGTMVTLNGSGSTDANSDTLTYLWTMTGKPANSTAVLSSATAVRPTFTADLAGTYAFSLVVNDGKVNSSTATVAVTATVSNIAPVANAGSAQSVNTGALVTLNGSGSTDANGDALTYAWTLTSKPTGSTAALSSATAVSPTFTADLAGTYVASLVVNDGKVSGTAATVTITANVPVLVLPGNTGKLNDTGVTGAGYDASGNYVASCASAAANNDCNTGRDATNNDDSDGKAGFSFTKIDANGYALPASATNWACVKDNVTGLIWENKTATNGALTYTGLNDNSAGDFSTYVTTVNSSGLCGAKDWRMPSPHELFSLLDYSKATGPMININWLPNTDSRGYWTSGTYLLGSEIQGLYVSFSLGTLGGTTSRELGKAVRLVRSAAALSNTGRYQISGAGDEQEVTDTQTGLIWRRCIERTSPSWTGTSCSTGSTFTHAQAVQRAVSIANASGKAWRLPSVKEVESLYLRDGTNVTIDTTAFPGASSMAPIFWTVTPVAADTANTWHVSPSGKVMGDMPRSTLYSVWLVRTAP